MSKSKGIVSMRSSSDRMKLLSGLSQAASSGPWSAAENPGHILGPETPDDHALFETVARAPACRRCDGDRRRQWKHDRAFIIACVNEIRLQLAEADLRRLKRRRARAMSDLSGMLRAASKDSTALAP